MKRVLALIVSSVFVAGVNATDWYDDFSDGNPDVSNQRLSAANFAGVQPSIGDSVDRYQGFADGNTDLFKGDGSQERSSTGRPDIYMNVSENPDLAF